MKEKEKELNVKNDKPDIKNKYYELGWFSTKIKEVKKEDLKDLKDVCKWIEAMCKLANEGWTRHIWGAKKKDDRGMLGILKVCKDNNFDKLKDLPNSIFDCVNLKKLLDEITKCVKNTYVGRTKSSGFSKSLTNCQNYITDFFETLRNASILIQSVIGYMNVPNQASTENSNAFFELGGIIWHLGNCETVSQENYRKLAKKTNIWLDKIIEEKKIERKNPGLEEYELRVKNATKALEKVIKTEDSWIDQKSLGQELANNLKKDLNIFNNLLKNNKIKFEDIKKN